MKYILSFLVLFFILFTIQAQYSLTVESSEAVNSEAGTTYRFYVDMADPTDRMTAVFGTNESHLIINTPDGAFNSSLNSSWSASGINPAFLAVFPDMADDTYATIGLDGPAASSGIAGTADPSLVEDPAEPISTYFVTDGATSLSSTTNFSTWYVVSSAENGLPDDDMRVLVLQVTTTGEINGTLSYQVFPLGVEADHVHVSNDFDGTGTFGGGPVSGCTDSTAFNYDFSAEYDDGSCIPVIVGCMDETACNFMLEANTSETCDYFSCLAIGCTNYGACNYDPTADFNDGSCEYAVSGYNCDGSCSFDLDGDGVCDSDEVLGCATSTACNYNEFATDDDGSCIYHQENYDCDGTCTLDENNNGICDFEEVIGCSNPLACNYNSESTMDDDSCEFVSCLVLGCVDISACNFDDGADIDDSTCEYALDGYDCFGSCLIDSDEDGVCDPFEILGCINTNATNYNPLSTDDDGSCIYPPDPILPPAEFGFTPTPYSGTFIGAVTLDDSNCEEIDWVAAFDPEGNCAGSAPVFIDGGVAYVILTIFGDESMTSLTDEGLSYGDYFTLQLFDASTLLIHEYYEETGVVEFGGWSNLNGAPLPDNSNPNIVYNFLSSEYIPSCLDPVACNFDASSPYNLNCVYPEIGYDCNGDCFNDTDNDGVCDELEIEGCTDSSSCNFSTEATNDDGSCATSDECGICGGAGMPSSDCDCDGNQLDALSVCGGSCEADVDADGVCDNIDDCVGALDECGVCNGPGLIYECGCADISEGECDCNGNQLDALSVCGGTCAVDQDADGVCDTEEISGCTDNNACNYDPFATEEDDSCATIDECGICGGEGIPEGDCDCNGNQVDALGICSGVCIEDLDLDGVCDVDEIWGCDDDTAINYNPLATENDGNCNYDTLGPETFTYSPTPISGTFYGTIKVDGVMATGLDWIAAFDEDENCAGATSILMHEGVAYANLTIYGDDLTTDIMDEGMNTGEDFELVFYDASEDVFITYSDDLGSEYLSGWENTYGAPIPAWNNPLTIFDFTIPLPCPGDFNENGQLDQSDLLIFLSAYGTPCTGCIQDISNNEFVDLADLLIFLASFGNACP